MLAGLAASLLPELVVRIARQASALGTFVGLLGCCKAWRTAFVAEADELWRLLALRLFPHLMSVATTLGGGLSYRELLRSQFLARVENDAPLPLKEHAFTVELYSGHELELSWTGKASLFDGNDNVHLPGTVSLKLWQEATPPPFARELSEYDETVLSEYEFQHDAPRSQLHLRQRLRVFASRIKAGRVQTCKLFDGRLDAEFTFVGLLGFVSNDGHDDTQLLPILVYMGDLPDTIGVLTNFLRAGQTDQVFVEDAERILHRARWV